MTAPRSLVLVVQASPAVAAELEPFLAQVPAEARRDGRVLSADALDFLEAVQAAAKASRSATLSRQGERRQPTLSSGSVAGMGGVDVPTAARRLGVRSQAVTERLRRGTLPGEKDEQGRWRIPSSALPKEADA
ncbi:MAG: hypothetical protein WB565_10060 [Acidimicrobiales bacterium]